MSYEVVDIFGPILQTRKKGKTDLPLGIFGFKVLKFFKFGKVCQGNIFHTDYYMCDRPFELLELF